MQDEISDRRRYLGHTMIWGSALILAFLVILQSLHQVGWLEAGFTTWRPTLYAYLFWATCLCWAQVILYGELGKRRLFILPAVLFVVGQAGHLGGAVDEAEAHLGRAAQEEEEGQRHDKTR